MRTHDPTLRAFMSHRASTTCRMKVFVSSLIGGYEQYRAAVVEAAEMLGHTVLRAEDLGATSASPQQACLGLVRESDVVVLLIGEHYGAVQPSGLSATHEEYREARERRPVLVFVEDPATRDARQAAFLAEVQDWATGHFRRAFSDATSLKAAVVQGLHEHELAVSHGSFDQAECLDRARSLLRSDSRGIGAGPELVVAIAAGPYQQVIRPAGAQRCSVGSRPAARGALRPERGPRPHSGNDRVRSWRAAHAAPGPW